MTGTEFQQTEETPEVQGLVELAEVLRKRTGGEIDDATIQAVSEATGAPIDYVRITLLNSERKRQKGLANLRSMFLALDPSVRMHVGVGLLALVFAASAVARVGTLTSSLFVLVQALALLGQAWVISRTRESRTAAQLGFVAGIGFATGLAVFGTLSNFINNSPREWVEFPFVLFYPVVGAVLGSFVYRVAGQFSRKIGIVDKVEERRMLLNQMVEIQAKLRTGERSVAFLSLDIVGSTRMKASSDALDVEFTFGEYQRYVQRAVSKYGGTIHSTAGDGTTCAFDSPAQAFSAARYIQAGLLEFNQFRNRIGSPIEVRAGIHFGTVVIQGDDIRDVNYAHVIDLAAHLQKEAPPGGIAISEESLVQIPGGPSQVGSEQVLVHQTPARIWRPNASPPARDLPGGPPPLPPGIGGRG